MGPGRLARAEAPAGTFSWVRAAGADACPARERLVEELDRALGRPLQGALEGRAVEAVITRDERGWNVTIYWRASDGTAAGTREIHDGGEGCEGAVRGVVTSVAVALTANAVDAPARGAAGSRASGDSAPPAPAAGAPPPSAPATTPAPVPAPPLAPVSSAPSPTAGLRTGGVMLGGVVALGWLPDVAYGIQLVAEPVVSGRFRFTSVATTVTTDMVQIGAVRAGFAAVELGGDLCAMLLSYEPLHMEASLCAGGRGGVVQAFVYSGLQDAGGASGSFALEAGAELRFSPMGPLLVGLMYSGRLNPVQYVLPGPGGEPLYTQNLAGMVGAVRIGVHFP